MIALVLFFALGFIVGEVCGSIQLSKIRDKACNECLSAKVRQGGISEKEEV